MTSKFKTLAIASNNFTNADYESALRAYADVLRDFPHSKEAYNGAILSEMAMSGEDAAEALFDYYEVLKSENKEDADSIIGEILSSLDGSMADLGSIFSDTLADKLEYEDGILYQDFKDIVSKENNFKTIFENIMFSTKVIITDKDDFIDFLESLLENNFKEMAINYIEGALSVYPNDKKIRNLLKKFNQSEIT